MLLLHPDLAQEVQKEADEEVVAVVLAVVVVEEVEEKEHGQNESCAPCWPPGLAVLW